MLITVRNQGFFFSPLIDDCFFSFLCWFETSFVTLELTRRNYSSVSVEPRTSANANTNRKTFLLYTCETWWMSKFSINKHQMFMKRYLWKMLWVRWQGRQTDEALWELTNQQFIEPQIKKKKDAGLAETHPMETGSRHYKSLKDPQTLFTSFLVFTNPTISAIPTFIPACWCLTELISCYLLLHYTSVMLSMSSATSTLSPFSPFRPIFTIHV